MKAVIWYRPVRDRKKVELHAWCLTGEQRDVLGQKDAATGLIRFELVLYEPNPLAVLFKLHFLDDDTWEKDDFVRRFPRGDATEVWIYDFSGRCLASPPGGPAPATVRVHALTQGFAGGFLHAWDAAATDRAQRINGTEQGGVTTFEVPIQPWMADHFHFKLGCGGKWERDRWIRVWQPSDGGEFWIKSGQLALRSEPLTRVPQSCTLVHPATVMPGLQLEIEDDNDEYEEMVDPSATTPLPGDPVLASSIFTLNLYPGSEYLIRVHLPNLAPSLVVDQPFVRPVTGGEPPSVIVLGIRDYLPAIPSRTEEVELVIHPNPRSAFGDQLPIELRTGRAPEELPQGDVFPAFERVIATRGTDGAWHASVRLFPGLDHTAKPLGEARADGELVWERTINIPAGNISAGNIPAGNIPAGNIPARARRVLHTIDGIAGVSSAPPEPVIFQEPPVERRALMGSAFDPRLVGIGLFSSEEMPHGTTFHDGSVWFVVRAPHAVRVDLLLLDGQDANGRIVRTRPMRCTPDLRYWWCAVGEGEAKAGTRYRFVINGREECLDPGSRAVQDRRELETAPGEGEEGAWSIVVDAKRLREEQEGASWKTMGWEALVVYELHPLRFALGDNLTPPAFSRIRESLRSGYLRDLPVTALELLPVHEFPSDLSWGYNPSLFFAIDSAYGGPGELAKLVRVAHDSGRAVLLDVVFNHFNNSPLQRIAKDVYVSGRTAWGDMTHYAHPACREYFRQALVYLWHTFDIDGFRFDCTKVMIRGADRTIDDPHSVIARGPDGELRFGRGGGWEFLGDLHETLRRAATALGRPWPYMVAENDPNDEAITDRDKPGVLDGQWAFNLAYALGSIAENDGDSSHEVAGALRWMSRPRSCFEAVRYAESHDSVSLQEEKKKRIAARERYGNGASMAKAILTVSLLARGVPMLFMGEEAGEELPFAFGFGIHQLGDRERYLRTADYQDPTRDYSRVLAWTRHLLGLRNDPAKGLRSDDDMRVATGRKTVAWTRDGGRIFVIATFGTPDTRQALGRLSLHGHAAYKEIFNSTWDPYRTRTDVRSDNPGLLGARSVVNLPPIGAVVLERAE